jgi:hypothetical protein
MYDAVICSDTIVRRRSLVPALLRPTLFASQRRSSFSMAASDSTGASQGSVGNGDTFNLCYNADVITSRSISVAMSGSVRLTEQAASCP